MASKRGRSRPKGSEFKRKDLDDDHPIYEKQSFETDVAWLAFKAYRDMDCSERSIRAAATALQKKDSYQSTMRTWSSKHWWPERCDAWDREQDKAEREVALAGVVEMKKRHLNQSKMLQAVAMSVLKGMLQEVTRLEKEEKNIYKELGITPKEMQTLLTTGQQSERLNRDEPGEITEQRNTITDLDKVQNEIKDILKRAKGK